MLLTALLHHAFPSRHQLLFAYDYRSASGEIRPGIKRRTDSFSPLSCYSEAYYSSLDKAVRLFRDVSDWHNELERTMSNEKFRKFWRLSTVNVDFKLCRR